MPDTENEIDSSQMAQDVQNELMDMIIADESPSNISDKIKDILYAKSAGKVDEFNPEVAQGTFASGEEEAAAAVANAAAHISGEVAAAQNAQAEE